MPIDLKGELTRPIALILSALAVLGWVLFVLSSWSAASVQKTQRMQILDLGERNEKVSADLARQVKASTAIADLEKQAAAARDDLSRITQTRNDAQAELASAQKTLQSTRRDINDADRTLQNQNQKLADTDQNPTETGNAAAAEPQAKAGRRGGRRSYRRMRRSYRVR